MLKKELTNRVVDEQCIQTRLIFLCYNPFFCLLNR